MSRAVIRGATALFLFAAGAFAQTTPPEPAVNAVAENTTVDFATGETVFSGNARIEHGDALLLADELRRLPDSDRVTIADPFSITYRGNRLLAKSGTYDLSTHALTLTNLRAGQPPIHLSASSAAGTADRLTLSNASVTYGEPGAFAPALRAGTLIYEEGHRLKGRNVRLDLGGFRLFALPIFDQDINAPLISYLAARAGYRRSLGVRTELGVHAPVWPGWQVGGDLGVYTERGVMLGPSGEYRFKSDTRRETAGRFRSGFISDHGDRLTDLLGRPVPKDRGFFEWRHEQRFNDRLTLSGEFHWWEDSEILRDFLPHDFTLVQQPDSWLEAVYAGNNHLLSAFARFHPNNYHAVQERLPEIRFDLLPLPIGAGFVERFNASFAALREDDLFAGPTRRSDRFDAYYALYRPIAHRDWLSITPMLGGRVTHYAKTNPGSDRGDYTRWLGEFGIDAELRAGGIFDYRNEFWRINGLRHLVIPRISYRYIPEAERGARYIPPIDRRVFSTTLEPLGLGATRNLDDLHRTDILRVGLDNILQTRDAAYGSRDLFALNFAADLNLGRRAGEARWSDVHTALEVAPAPWLQLNLRKRLSSRTFALRELAGSLEINDIDWWTLRMSANYLQHEIEEYFVEGEARLSETWRASARFRYDARLNRWNEQLYGLTQTLRNIWRVRYEVSWQEGRRRESSFGFNLEVDLIRF